MSRSFEELTGDTAVANWVPSEAWADMIIEASVCYGELSGVVTALEYDLAAGNGNDVKVRANRARTTQGPITTGDCLDAASSTFDVYTITIAQYGDYDLMEAFSLFTAKGPVKDSILNEMAKAWAKKRDELIWAQLVDGLTPGFSISMVSAFVAKDKAYRWPNWAIKPATTGAGSAPSNSAIWGNADNLYNAIAFSVGTMRAKNCANPDMVIMSPIIAGFLKMLGGLVGGMNLTTGKIALDNGRITRMPELGLKVIESSNAGPRASSAATDYWTSGATIAVVIDSKRAVGEAWGKRAQFYEDFVVDCNNYKETFWSYWGTSELSKSAICHINNP